jgi:hypothetical protein
LLCQYVNNVAEKPSQLTCPNFFNIPGVCGCPGTCRGRSGEDWCVTGGHNGSIATAFDVRSAAGRFRLVALAEAVTWVGLLTGMYFKYLADPRTEIWVKIFGMAHGIVFIAFVISAILVGRVMSWRISTWLLALVGSIVPLGSVAFLLWADRSAQLGPRPGPGTLTRA